ncbi:MAG: hypothetical protein ACP5M7_10515, partial [Thermoproteota archaeon]
MNVEQKAFNFTATANLADLPIWPTNKSPVDSEGAVYAVVDFLGATAVGSTTFELIDFPPMTKYEDVHNPILLSFYQLLVGFNTDLKGNLRISPETTASGDYAYTITYVSPRELDNSYEVKIKAYYSGTYSVTFEALPVHYYDASVNSFFDAYAVVDISPQKLQLSAGQEATITITYKGFDKKPANPPQAVYVFRIKKNFAIQSAGDLSVSGEGIRAETDAFGNGGAVNDLWPLTSVEPKADYYTVVVKTPVI